MSDSKSVVRTQRRNKLRAVEYLGNKCSICGYNKCLGALEFHHTDPSIKEIAPSHAIHCWTWEKAKVEVDKCILVCSNCHKEIHYGLHEVEGIKKYIRPELKKVCSICEKEFVTRNEEQKFCCMKCNSISQRKTNRPTKEELEKLVWEMPNIHIAKQYGVSNKAIEKWCKSYGIERPGNGYWTKKRYGIV